MSFAAVLRRARTTTTTRRRKLTLCRCTLSSAVVEGSENKHGADLFLLPRRRALTSNASTTTSAPSVSHSSNFSRDNNYQIPKGSFDQKIRYVLSLVPVGCMDSNIAAFCKRTIDRLGRQGNTNNNEVPLSTAEALLKRLEQEARVNMNIRLTATPYNQIIRAWARAPTDSSAWEANRVLERIKGLHRDNPQRFPAPDNYTYGAALYACTLSLLPEATTLADRLVREVEELGTNNPDGPVFPTKSLYDNVILAHANQAASHYGAAADAEDWLMYVSKLSTQGGDITPDTKSFNRVLKAWSVSPEEKGADRALEILNLMIKLDDDLTKPDAISFGTTIYAFAKRNHPVEAEEVLKKAIEYVDAHAEETTDLTGCLDTTIISWSQSDQDDAADRIEALLRDATTAFLLEGGHSRIVIAPSAVALTCYVESQMKSTTGSSDDLMDGLNRAEKCLRKMVPYPPAAAFQAVIKGWRRSRLPEAAQRATALFHEMISLADENGVHCHPERGTVDMIIDMWIKEGGPEMPSNLVGVLNLAEKRKLTHSNSYHRVIDALCQANTAEATFLAARLLANFVELADPRGMEWNPQRVIGLYTAVIGALALIGTDESAESALQILRGIPMAGKRDLKATVRTYTGVINAFSKLRNQRSGQVAFEIFNEMKLLDADPSSKVLLDSVAFFTVLRTLASAGDTQSASHACDVLAHMLELHRSGRKDVEPDERCLASSVKAFARCDAPAGVDKAASLLKVLIRSYKKGELSQTPQSEAMMAVVRGWKRAGVISDDTTDILLKKALRK